jgi:hypothetical protein
MDIRKKLLAYLLREAEKKDAPTLELSDIDFSLGFKPEEEELLTFALESPENLVSVLIFVVATQEKIWPAVVTKFPVMMRYIDAHNGLYPEDGQRREEGFPESFREMAYGERATSIDTLWKKRDDFYRELKPLLLKYKNAGKDKKLDAAFEVYIALLGTPSHGFPKAGFATQLLIGEFACIDSINAQLLAIPPSLLGKPDKSGKVGFKSVEKTKLPDKALSSISRRSVDLAIQYGKWLKSMEKTKDDSISKTLWNYWCAIVAHKINFPSSHFSITDKAGYLAGGRIGSNYPANYSSSNIAGMYPRGPKGQPAKWTDISREHPVTISRGAIKFESLKKLILNVLLENNTNITKGNNMKLKKIILEELSKILSEKAFAGKKELDNDEDGVPKWADKDDNNPKVGSKSAKKKKELDEMSSMSAGSAEGFVGKKKREILEEDDALVEYLTEEESKSHPPLGKVTRNPAGSNKKFHVYVKCGGRVKKISFGDPGLSIKRDSPERRKNFRARHKCDKAEGKNRCTARYWSCYQWRAGKKVEGE